MVHLKKNRATIIVGVWFYCCNNNKPTNIKNGVCVCVCFFSKMFFLLELTPDPHQTWRTPRACGSFFLTQNSSRCFFHPQRWTRWTTSSPPIYQRVLLGGSASTSIPETCEYQRSGEIAISEMLFNEKVRSWISWSSILLYQEWLYYQINTEVTLVTVFWLIAFCWLNLIQLIPTLPTFPFAGPRPHLPTVASESVKPAMVKHKHGDVDIVLFSNLQMQTWWI